MSCRENKSECFAEHRIIGSKNNKIMKNIHSDTGGNYYVLDILAIIQGNNIMCWVYWVSFRGIILRAGYTGYHSGE